MPSIFVSHASADRELVSEFVERILDLGCGVPSDEVFYSSSPGQGVPVGEDLPSYVRKQAADAKLVIAIITPQFQRRPYCWTELGLAWGRAGVLFPLALPGMEREHFDDVLTGVMVGYLDDPDNLNELKKRIHRDMAFEPTDKWENQRDRWLKDLPALSNGSRSGDARTEPGRASTARDATDVGTQYEWGQLFESFVDAALHTPDEELAKEEVERSVQLNTLIPSRYLYSSDLGAKRWTRLCGERSYKHHQATMRFWQGSVGAELVKFIYEELRSDTLDFISLGPGDGIKDAWISGRWLDADIDVLYYPYDISVQLACRAANEVYERGKDSTRGRLHIKAVLADFDHLRTMRQVFAHRVAPNVIGLLGNTLGNTTSEGAFLQRLRAAMNDDDLLLLEVRKNSGSNKAAEVESEGAKRFDFGPLEYYLGVDFDKAVIDSYVVEGDLSDLENKTRTTVVRCREAEHNGRTIADIPLVYIHQYDEEEFDSFVIAEEQGFEIVRKVTNKTFLVYLLRPAGGQRKAAAIM